MDMEKWARKEIELSCNGNDEECGYYKACCESAFRAFKTLLDDGHSGMSIGITKQILDSFIDGKPLSPITENDSEEIWEEYGKDYGPFKDGTYFQQCSRKTSLFRYTHPDGSITYSDVDRVICHSLKDNISFTNGFFSNLVEEKYPLTLPYVSERYYLYINDEYESEDYSIYHLVYMIKPDKTREEINRYFVGYPKKDRQEITEEEYNRLKEIIVNENL